MSDSEGPQTPPRENKILRPYTSPDAKALAAAITAGGKNTISGIPKGTSNNFLPKSLHANTHTDVGLTDPQRIEEDIKFYPVEMDLRIADLMVREPPRFETESNEYLFFAKAIIFLNRPLGQGQFKTAVAGQLICLGALMSTFAECVYKRPFKVIQGPTSIEETDRVKLPVERLMPVEELSMLVVETNSHLWAVSLLNTSYDYLKSLINDPIFLPPPDTLLDLSFVQAGLAICLKDEVKKATRGKSKTKATKTTSLVFSALVEETLPDHPFIRFTGNAVANPETLDDDEDAAVNEFQAFMLFLQHVQLKITKNLCYISDWQGVSELSGDDIIYFRLLKLCSHGIRYRNPDRCTNHLKSVRAPS